MSARPTQGQSASQMTGGEWNLADVQTLLSSHLRKSRHEADRHSGSLASNLGYESISTHLALDNDEKGQEKGRI